MAWNPQADTETILDRAWAIVSTTPYAVTARFVFYQLLGEGYYTPRNDEEKRACYKDRFLKTVSRARRENYKQWRPDSLVDDTRTPLVRGQGFDSVQDWLQALSRRLRCNLDLWHSQPYYVELWTEHRGMVSQFEYYTEGITIRPMGGQPSIVYKYEAAQDLGRAAQTYDRQPVVLYFGDLDKGGKTIAAKVKRDIAKWCPAAVTFEWCGITQDHADRFNLPDNPEKPGQYQWEALGHERAGEVIQETVARFVRPDAMSEVMQEARQATHWLQSRLATIADEWEAD